MWMTLQWPIVNKLVLSHQIQNKCYIICMIVINNNILLPNAVTRRTIITMTFKRIRNVHLNLKVIFLRFETFYFNWHIYHIGGTVAFNTFEIWIREISLPIFFCIIDNHLNCPSVWKYRMVFLSFCFTFTF